MSRPLVAMVWLTLLLLSGCDESTRPRSLIDQFKVVGIRCDPPDVSLDKADPSVRVNTLVADPTDSGIPLEYAVIACTNYDGVIGCLEEASMVDLEDLVNGTLEFSEEDYHKFFAQFVKRGRVDDPGRAIEFSQEIEIPTNYQVLIDELGYSDIDAKVYVLVCQEGTCPLLDDIDAYLAGDPDAPTGEELLYTISIPEELAAGSSMETSALARKTYRVLEQTSEAPNHNPGFGKWQLVNCDQLLSSSDPSSQACTLNVELDPDSLEIYYPTEGSDLWSQEVAVVRFYSTAGEMVPHTVQFFSNGSEVQGSELQLQEGENPERVDFFLVVEDSRSGLNYESLLDAIH